MYATIFYSKNTGRIATYCITEVPQSLEYFGEDKVDYEQIYDYLVLEDNEQVRFIIKNRDMFLVDVENRKIIQKTIDLDL